MTALCLTLLAVGCLGCVPMGFEADKGDGGVDYPPVIVDSFPQMPGPGSIVIGAPVETYTVDVKDNDLGDHLFLRVFRNDLTIGPVTTADKPGGDTAIRKFEISNASWCELVPPGESRYFDVVVADQDFLAPTGADSRKLPEGAESSRMTWVFKCQDM